MHLLVQWKWKLNTHLIIHNQKNTTTLHSAAGALRPALWARFRASSWSGFTSSISWLSFADWVPLWMSCLRHLSISQDQSMQTLELPACTVSSVCPPRQWNLSVESEPAKINETRIRNATLDVCPPGRTMLPDLTLFSKTTWCIQTIKISASHWLIAPRVSADGPGPRSQVSCGSVDILRAGYLFWPAAMSGKKKKKKKHVSVSVSEHFWPCSVTPNTSEEPAAAASQLLLTHAVH